jgi:hypothetical protein
MSQSAQVYSIDLLQRLHTVLARCGVDGQTALASGEAEIRRTFDELEDRLKYWQQQVNKRHEERNQARASLSHARALSEGRNTGCVEQEIALRKAEQRLREAEEKVITVRRWQRQLPEMVKDYEGPARGLSGYLEADLQQALVLLMNKITTLEAYVAIASSDEPRPATPAAPAPAPEAPESP